MILSLVCLMCIMTAGYAAFSTNLNITAKGNILEKSRVIQSWTSASNENFHSSYYKENIISATFLDNNNVPDSATEYWNVSEDKDKGGVMAWVIPTEGDSTKYDLYIGANNGVIANEDSSYLFYQFTNMKTIDFNNNFDTSNTRLFTWSFGKCENLIELNLNSFDTKNVTDMSFMFRECINLTQLNISSFVTTNVNTIQNMFYNCSSLTSLDLGHFDTSNVTNMNATFLGCKNLKELNISNFNTSKVTTMWDMFHGCSSLTSLNLSNFDTSNVTDFNQMFWKCTNLEELILCSFNTQNATNMNRMFGYMPNLQIIKVGPNWTTANATTTEMFLNNNISSVTTGQCE